MKSRKSAQSPKNKREFAVVCSRDKTAAACSTAQFGAVDLSNARETVAVLTVGPKGCLLEIEVPEGRYSRRDTERFAFALRDLLDVDDVEVVCYPFGAFEEQWIGQPDPDGPMQ